MEPSTLLTLPTKPAGWAAPLVTTEPSLVTPEMTTRTFAAAHRLFGTGAAADTGFGVRV